MPQPGVEDSMAVDRDATLPVLAATASPVPAAIAGPAG